ncbi:MAG TPA: CARDB domain-containing protein [Solirubrobacterales bacterium]|jgi:hypothetical protein
MKLGPSTRRLRLAGCLLAACAALLAFAATASAAVWTGESTAAQSSEGLPAEATLVKGSASYDTSGSVSITLTTAAPLLERLGAEPNEINIMAFLFKPLSECTAQEFLFGKPEIGIFSSYASPATGALYNGPAGEVAEEATKTVAGAATTLSHTSGAMANAGFSCAAIILADENPGSGFGESLLAFPLVEVPAPPTPPATSTPPAPTPPAPPTPPPPAKLAIAKSKPLKLKAGKWKTVKVKVTNPGTVTSSQGSLTVNAAKGIKVKPATQTVPALAPGGSWTLSIKVQATATAPKKSTLSLTAAASGVSATSSLVVKLK